MSGSRENIVKETKAAVTSAQNTTSLKKGSTGFLGSVLALSGGAVIAQAIGMIFTPVITRLFLPEAFGIAAIFASIVTVGGLVSCFTYERAILLPKTDEEASNIFVLCCILLLGVTGLVVLLTGLVGTELLEYFEASEFTSYKWLVPCGVFLFGLAGPLRYWNTRHKQFKRLALVRIEASAAYIFLTIGIGFAGFTTGLFLILARMLGLLAPPVIMGWYLCRHDVKYIWRNQMIGKMWSLATRYKKFPLFNSWHELISQTSRELPTILLAAFFDIKVTGLYAMARTLVSLPNHLIATAIGQVFFQHTAAIRAEGGSLNKLFEKAVEKLTAIGLLPMLVVALIGPELFGIVLGAEWTHAGFYASILTIWLFFMFVCSPLTVLFNVLERQGTNLFLSVAFLGVSIVVLVLGGMVIHDIVITLILFSLTGAIFNAGRLYILAFATKVRLITLINIMFRYIIYALPTFVIISISKWILGIPSVYVLFVSLVACVPYIWLILRHDKELLKLISQRKNK
jgi:lipopolysaccharide exporter